MYAEVYTLCLLDLKYTILFSKFAPLNDHCHLESALAIKGCTWSATVFEWVACEA